MNEAIVFSLVVAALAAMTLGFVRVLRGPTQADRIVALDIVFSCNVAMTVAAAVAHDAPLFLDVGLGLGLVGFLATLLWARLLEKSAARAPSEGEGGVDG